MPIRRLALTLGFLLTLPFASLEAAPSLDIAGTRLGLTLDDGRRLTDATLIGVVLEIADEKGALQSVRIDAVSTDPRDRTGDVVLYDMKVKNRQTGAWQHYCLPDPDGEQLAIALPAEGQGFRLTCTAGGIGKCVRFGYHPWKVAADGRPMADYHTACLKLMRGEYCGDGEAFTENGTLVDVYDRIGVQQPDNNPDLAFEAAWGPQGAICVAHTRKPNVITLEQLKKRCPKVEIRASCDETASGALVFNRSRLLPNP